MKQNDRRKLIAKAIKLVNESFESHADWIYDDKTPKCKYCGTANFHRKAMEDYMKIMDILLKLAR